MMKKNIHIFYKKEKEKKMNLGELNKSLLEKQKEINELWRSL